MPKYTSEELWKLYQKLPKELQDVLFSEETANQIENICKRYGLDEDKTSKVAEQVGYVFLGILPVEEFQNSLVVEAQLEEEVAERVAREIYRYVFYPVKLNLEQLYAPLSKEEKRGGVKEDIYREPVE